MSARLSADGLLGFLILRKMFDEEMLGALFYLKRGMPAKVTLIARKRAIVKRVGYEMASEVCQHQHHEVSPTRLSLALRKKTVINKPRIFA